MEQKFVKIISTFATPTLWCSKETKWNFSTQKQKNILRHS